MNLTLYAVRALLVLDAATSGRVLAKYYVPPAGIPAGAPTGAELATVKEQKAFERRLWDKTRKQLTAEVILFENYVVVYKAVADVLVYVVGSLDENEVMLAAALHTVVESVNLVLLKYQSTDKQTIVDHMDLVALAVDECIDQGVVLETDPGTIAARVSKRPSEMADISLGDPQSISDALNKAKEQFFAGVLLK
ncbi:Golgi-to-ER vesicle coat component [Blastocladiella emersonii ATCC 22665]|nr:Golgi-to-ER vesicle coat component [Blastocladiella emersonii ATCC 22665]